MLYDTKNRKWDDVAWGIALSSATLGEAEVAKSLNCSVPTLKRQLAMGKPSERPRSGRSAHPEQARRRERLKVLCAMTYKTRGTRVGKRVTKVRMGEQVKYPTLALLGRKLHEEGFECTSRKTLHGDFMALKHRWFKRPTGPILSDKERKARVTFARFWLPRLKTGILFSDESTFDCNDRGHRGQWALSRSTVLKRGRSSSGARLSIWGLIGVGVKKFVAHAERKPDPKTKKVPGMNAKKYLKTCVKPSYRILKQSGRQFMQDGAKIHKAKIISQYLKNARITVVDNWPANSPDLNPIENLWSLLKRRVSRYGPLSFPELKRFVERECENLGEAFINKYVESFEKRLKECIKKNGAKVSA